ncbi:MAG: HEAT repeat domain-containing protein [Ignavibacteriales bacterium]|nr:HEAT repeat domain-containing protein [Ignavibacteriales bacterium]
MEKQMEHNDYKEMIQFYLYEELDLDKKKIFEDHVKTCNECKLELEAYKKLFADIQNDVSVSVNPNLLHEARLELRGQLRAQRNSISFVKQIFNSVYSMITKPAGLAFSGFSILLIGMFISYLIFKSPSVENSQPNPLINDQIKISNINFTDPDPSDGQVEFTFDIVKPGHFKGNISDPKLQQFLTYAVLNAQNPGTRLNSINLINVAKGTGIDDEIKNSLITVAKYDGNPGVRREALKSLNEIPMDTEIKNTFIYVLLNDTSAGIRIEAINNLVDAAKKGYSFSVDDLSKLRNKIQVDNNNYVRLQAKNIIKEY